MGVSERRRREKEERRNQILAAAESVFLEKGFSSATMEEVASAVELSKGALYLYFRSKDELYLAIVNRRQAKLIDELSGEFERDLTGLELVAVMTRTYVRFVRAYPDHTRLMLAKMAAGDFGVEPDSPASKEHRDMIGKELGLFFEAVARGKRDRTIREDVLAQNLAMHVWGGLMGMMMLELNGARLESELPGPIDMEPVVPSFVHLVLRGIAAHPDTALPRVSVS